MENAGEAFALCKWHLCSGGTSLIADCEVCGVAGGAVASDRSPCSFQG